MLKYITKCALIMLMLMALFAQVALGGLLEAEPMETAEESVPKIIPESTLTPTSWTMPKTFRATRGKTYQLVEPIPYDRQLPTIYAKSSRPEIVSVSDQGVITAKEYGKAVITIKGADNKLIKCGVEVVDNEFERIKAAAGHDGDVVTSTKRLYYKDNELRIEIYVLNRTGATLTELTGMTLQFLRGDDVLYERPMPDWESNKGIKNGDTIVYKTSLSKEEVLSFTSKAPDLGSGEYRAIITINERGALLDGTVIGSSPAVGGASASVADDGEVVIGSSMELDGGIHVESIDD